LVNIFKQKNKTAAWFVSNCASNNRREELVKSLQGFIDVSVFGLCGNMTCGADKCYQMLDTDYKFYLSFENGYNEDYITEKTFGTMKHNVIPVIFSGAKLSQFLPPKSYINADSFATVEELAKHLQFLSNNANEYVKHFWWRKHYEIVPQKDLSSSHICNICKKLNDPELLTKQRMCGDVAQWSHSSIRTPNLKF
jgi:alpha-1,3-fucosyltransferase